MNKGQDEQGLRIVPVLAGGGSRLSAHIGALQAISDMELRYQTLVGVSGGSIVGALLAADHSLPAIRRIAQNTDFSRFAAQNLISLLRTGGMSNGNSFEAWMDELLDGRTFAELTLDYYVVATDVRSGQPVVFSRHSHPDMRVSQAVRFSMSVPILFSFKEYGEYLLVDGSILSEEALQRNWAGDGTPVIVFKLRSSAPLRKPSKPSLLPLRGYLEMLVRTFMTTISREYINEEFWLSTIVIETGDTSALDLRLSLAQKDQLYTAGFEITRAVLPAKLSKRIHRSVE